MKDYEILFDLNYEGKKEKTAVQAEPKSEKTEDLIWMRLKVTKNEMPVFSLNNDILNCWSTLCAKDCHKNWKSYGYLSPENYITSWMISMDITDLRLAELKLTSHQFLQSANRKYNEISSASTRT